MSFVGVGVGVPMGASNGLPFGDATLGADFTNGQYQLNGLRYSAPSLLPGWSFSRSGAGTALDSAGNVISFATGVPRITDRGLLVEEARTNLCLRSQEFDNASWTVVGTSITANATLAPDLTATADLMTENSATSNHTVLTSSAIAISSGVVYTFSIFAKPNGRTLLQLRDNATSNTGATFSLSGSGSVTNTEAAVTATSITALANGWYRLSIAYTSGTTVANVQPRLVSTGTTTNYTGDGVSGAYLWGAQLEAGAFPTSYIPTAGASATRAADAALVSGMSIANLHTIYGEVEHVAPSGAAQRYAVSDNGTANERTFLGRSSGGLVQGFVTAGGSTTTSSAVSGAVTGTVKGAVSVGASSFICSRSGLIASAVSSSPPTGETRLGIGSSADGDSPLNGYVRKIIIYPSAFSDAELQAITA